MEIKDKNGDIIISDKNMQYFYPTGCNGTSIFDFYQFFEKNQYGITPHTRLEIENNSEKLIKWKNGEIQGYFVRSGYKNLIPEILRDERKKKLEKLKCL